MSNQGSEPIEFPKTDKPETKAKPGRKAKKLYYMEDFAGLWVYIQVGEKAKLLTPYPFTLATEKQEIKDIIDAFK